ncbi:hypothetical protein JKA74_13735 [Marivirga sp. S37H4]|uniref:Uncharacterized protein n=1 Tax=Marivirga aurantiaca TaxID=2802615 RepID=A0A934X0C6_9BACT|nr:hypothetical protein [Marivirga aurantiaca]MBK6266100.1 hypothetical protein [Marivirga aurantiaca]
MKKPINALFLRVKICALIFPLFLLSCNKDVMFVDDLFGMSGGNELLNISYQLETHEFNEYLNGGGIASTNREAPIVKREKIEIKLMNTGEVEMFSESLIPSIQTGDINESLPSTNAEIKFQHYKNGMMHLYDANRKLLDEFELPEINQLFNEVFVQVQNGAINESYLQSTISGGVMFMMPKDFDPAANTQGRIADPLKNDYDDSPYYNVLRNKFTDGTGIERTNELIIHKGTNTLRYASVYDADLSVVARSIFQYKDENGIPKLDYAHEEHYETDENGDFFKSVTLSNYEDFTITINL